jgi:hypothetical protein
VIVQEVERPLTEEEVREPLSLDDLLAAAFEPVVPPYGYRPSPGLVLPKPREC